MGKKIFSKEDRNNVEIGLIIASVLLLAGFIVFMVLNPESTINAISSFFWKMISGLGPIFQTFTFVTFIIAIYLGVGKYGKVRLGDCKPEYSTLSYIGMMILASLASAALYWSFTEWAYYYEAPGLGMEPLSVRALETSLSYQFFHWGMTNQAMYTVMGVAIAYGVYIKKVPSFQTSAVCSAMMGEKVKGTRIVFQHLNGQPAFVFWSFRKDAGDVHNRPFKDFSIVKLPISYWA